MTLVAHITYTREVEEKEEVERRTPQSECCHLQQA